MTEPRIDEPFGPKYPAMPGLRKYRRAADAAGGVARMEKAFRQEYGAAVEKQIKALQRAAFSKAAGTTSPRCASGSWANTAKGIENAVRGRQAREIAAAARRDREGRSDATIEGLYAEAMEAKWMAKREADDRLAINTDIGG